MIYSAFSSCIGSLNEDGKFITNAENVRRLRVRTDSKLKLERLRSYEKSDLFNFTLN